MTDVLFRDRRDAGRVLVGLLAHHGRAVGADVHNDVVVLGLPRGGVPVAYEVAAALGVPLDVWVVRKLGLPGHPELAMGALASGGVAVLNNDVVRRFRVSTGMIAEAAEAASHELARRERAYRAGRRMVDVARKTVILVDDGLATGASMRAAVRAVRALGPARLVAAVPAAPPSRCPRLAAEVDELVCVATPAPFHAVGAAYHDFAQTTDDEVRALLHEPPADQAVVPMPTSCPQPSH